MDAYAALPENGFPSESDTITDDVTYYGLALNGNSGQSLVEVMNTDTCFHLFMLNTTLPWHAEFLNNTALSVLRPFPAGLRNPVGLLVANPAYGTDPVYAQNFTSSTYHGTVVWGWQMAMMASGLERQLGRCTPEGDSPPFCDDSVVYGNVRAAYNSLWDLAEANANILTNEVWSWTYENGAGYEFAPLGSLPPPRAPVRPRRATRSSFGVWLSLRSLATWHSDRAGTLIDSVYKIEGGQVLRYNQPRGVIPAWNRTLE